MFKRFIAISILIGFIPLPVIASIATYEKPITEYTQIVEEESPTYVAEIIEPSHEEMSTIILGSPIESEPTTEEIIPEVETEVESETIAVNEPETEKPTPTTNTEYTDEEVELLTLVMLAEAEGEDEYGRRLVVSTILNRVESDKYPNTIYEVVYQEGQFSSMFNGRAERVVITDKDRDQVRRELESRTNYEVMYFRMYYYHSWGTPLFVYGCHYFSGV